MSELIDSIRRAVKQMIKPAIVAGKVKSFDGANWTAEITIDGLDIEVRTKAVINSDEKGIFVEPVVGSDVLCAMIEDRPEALVVIQWSEIVKYRLKGDLIELNGDQYSIVKAETLQQVMDQNAQFIDALKQVLSTPVNEPGNGAPSAFQAALNIALSPLQWGDHSNIHSTTVKHG